MSNLQPGSLFISKNRNEYLNTTPWSVMNHCAIYFKDNIIIEATEDKGVIETTISDYKKRDYNFIILEPLDLEVGKIAAYRAKSLVGVQYRYIASIFLLSRRDWRGESCVSLVRKCYETALKRIVYWVVPDDIFYSGIFKRIYQSD